ncbi:sugar phosphate isomerase/epimerase and 4-hydroxyphenylpyruvate domain-containing protein [Polymorphobacter sp. PAMC 29334]|uniref:bifunctional sugar phosphate isomerase/epimerase/4-hydroxyphenylpyruvate dioxygenase family protein n=1 Tax=Polymorphobacter sp. PAMC 29334 TaxID=2862331 RepID=UPI001C67978C|nr:sugar phosphate isomerase/epimerase and 4-hydroxyphenylpyruvate domain-containing protein [Polymorphobacter sp. PAMC 29334]QYE36397.1 sugar phosphate isomerase/epimerase and 4-hydroxyphenylpyruvate domain-containing protein [Polymorphobacter sp. PAMC 29334]
MLKSIATVALSGALVDKIAATARAGYAGVEIFENDLTVADIGPREIAARIADAGLVCTCFQPFRDFEGLRGPARARAFDRAERKFELMHELGAELMLVCSSVAPDTDGDPERLAADFAELGERAAISGVRVGYEALAWGRHVFDHRQAWDIVRRANHPSIGLILDSFHSLARSVPIASIVDIPGDRIFLLQIADAPGVPMDPLYLSRHFRCFPGQGDFAVTDYVAAVVAQGYQGPLSLEIFNDRFRGWAADQIADDGYRSLVVLEDDVRALTAEAALDPPLPYRGEPSGITFVEFAAAGDEARDLETWFGQLGFASAGRHRTKAVTRWRQGEVNFVINEEPAGFAHSHHLLHGASVCAFGIGVGDPAGTMARAKRLGMEAFAQNSGPGELAVPSLRAVGGSLLYFTPDQPDEAFWATDFVATGVRERAGHGLRHVDHLAQSMPPEEFLSWQLYYTSLLAVERTAAADVADPRGIVQSQPIESADGSLRITLNGAAGQTLASRFVDRYFGAGVQHIAFTTDDIFSTVVAMRAGGVEMLTIPPNYYDDLRARFGLDDALLEQLAAHGVMFDRVGDGLYLQAYTRAFKQRLFFEVVERRDYSGYGAANAPVRLAAQARLRTPPQF